MVVDMVKEMVMVVDMIKEKVMLVDMVKVLVQSVITFITFIKSVFIAYAQKIICTQLFSSKINQSKSGIRDDLNDNLI